MKSPVLHLVSLAVALGAVLPLPAQELFKPDGAPDPDFPVPEALSLRYAVAFALDNNFAIRQAKERIRQQDGIVVEVRAAQAPTVTTTAGYSRNAKEVTSNGYDYAWSVGITARQVIYAGGGITNSVRSQELAREAAVLAMQAVVNDALLEVRTRYYNVLVSRERIKVQEQNIELLRRQLQDVRNRYEAGTVSNFEVLRAEVALANAQPALITANNSYRSAIDDLRKSIGFTNASPGNVARVPEFVGQLEFQRISYDLVAALASARENRPDLRRLRILEDAAQAGVLARQAGNRPYVSLFGSYDWRRAALGSADSVRDGWTAGVQAQWDIFDGRATAGQVAQARSQVELARLAAADFQLTIDVQVRRAISALQEATELAESTSKVVGQAEESLRLANARYGAGTATQLDVLTSQVDLTTARLNQLEANYRFNVAVAVLRHAMGQGDELASGS